MRRSARGEQPGGDDIGAMVGWGCPSAGSLPRVRAGRRGWHRGSLGFRRDRADGHRPARTGGFAWSVGQALAAARRGMAGHRPAAGRRAAAHDASSQQHGGGNERRTSADSAPHGEDREQQPARAVAHIWADSATIYISAVQGRNGAGGGPGGAAERAPSLTGEIEPVREQQDDEPRVPVSRNRHPPHQHRAGQVACRERPARRQAIHSRPRRHAHDQVGEEPEQHHHHQPPPEPENRCLSWGRAPSRYATTATMYPS